MARRLGGFGWRRAQRGVRCWLRRCKIAGHLGGATQQRARSRAPDRHSPRATLLRQIFLRRRKVSPNPARSSSRDFQSADCVARSTPPPGRRSCPEEARFESRASSAFPPPARPRQIPGLARNSPPAHRAAFFSNAAETNGYRSSLPERTRQPKLLSPLPPPPRSPPL